MKSFFVFDKETGNRVGEVYPSLTELMDNLPEEWRVDPQDYMVQERDHNNPEWDQSQCLDIVVAGFNEGERPEDLDFF